MLRLASFPKTKTTKAKRVSGGHPITYRWDYIEKVLPSEQLETILNNAKAQHYFTAKGKRCAAEINCLIANSLISKGASK